MDLNKLEKDGHTYVAKFKVINGVLYRQKQAIIPGKDGATLGAESTEGWADEDGNPIGATEMVANLDESTWYFNDPLAIDQTKKDLATFVNDPAMMKTIAPKTGETNLNEFLRPPAGITSVDSETEGPLGHSKLTTINFLIYVPN